MGQLLYDLVFVLTLAQVCFAPPVTKTKEEQAAEEADVLQDYMEYHRYLRQVVNALESDPEFRKKLESAAEADIKSGKIAHELEFVDHNIRTRLDELKRTELQRLKDLVRQKEMMGNEIDDGHHHHLDASNPHTFEINDLKNLILKTTSDLQEADRKRRDEFKEYELQKEYDKRVKLNHTEGDDRVKLEKEYQTNDEQHKKHEKLHEPGHKAQLEEVWEQQDHMQQEFDPKAFFMLHDLDNNRLWDQDEVKALFIKELDKMYKAGSHQDDMRERIEEMERMRETVFIEMDLNRDGFIDYNEFVAQTKRQEFQRDNGWQSIDEEKQYTNEELEEYISRHHAQNGYYPPGGYPQHEMHPNQQPPPYYDPQMGHPPPHPNQMHPNQIPQQQQQHHPQQVPPQGNPQFPNSQQQQHPGNLNTNEIHPSQQNHQPNMVANNNQQPPQYPNLTPEQQQLLMQQQQMLLQQFQQQREQGQQQKPVVNQQQHPNSVNQQQAKPAVGNTQQQYRPPPPNVVQV